MKNTETTHIIELIKKEVVPAIGCTEPVAVALCVAKASELLAFLPEKIDVFLSANVLKNAMGVGIPGTGMIGLPIAIALGAIAGKSEYGLEVLRDITPEDVAFGKKMIERQIINIQLKKEIDDKLYIESVCYNGDKTSKAVIAGEHTTFVHLSVNDEIFLSKERQQHESEEKSSVQLSMRKVYDFSTQTPIDQISFILEAGKMNKEAAEKSFQGNYGHNLGRILTGENERSVIGNNILADIMSYTSAACDARMAGAMIPVMTNSGSGNQGISATLPVMIFAEENNKNPEELIRALILSNLTVIYIKQHLGRLSALCGCVVAATGSSCGITYLMGGNYDQICYAVKNMIANLTGMICDGAKPSCAMKVTSGAATAVLSAMLAIEKKCVTSVEGIIDEDVDQCIRNLTDIGAYGMCQTDEMVLDIMINKKGGAS